MELNKIDQSKKKLKRIFVTKLSLWYVYVLALFYFLNYKYARIFVNFQLMMTIFSKSFVSFSFEKWPKNINMFLLFCFIISFCYSAPAISQSLWLAGPGAPALCRINFFFFLFTQLFSIEAKIEKMAIHSHQYFCCWLLLILISETWDLRKSTKKKQWPMKLNIANVTQHADCCRQFNVEREEKMNFKIICYSVLCD